MLLEECLAKIEMAKKKVHQHFMKFNKSNDPNEWDKCKKYIDIQKFYEKQLENFEEL